MPSSSARPSDAGSSAADSASAQGAGGGGGGGAGTAAGVVGARTRGAASRSGSGTEAPGSGEPSVAPAPPVIGSTPQGAGKLGNQHFQHQDAQHKDEERAQRADDPSKKEPSSETQRQQANAIQPQPEQKVAFESTGSSDFDFNSLVNKYDSLAANQPALPTEAESSSKPPQEPRPSTDDDLSDRRTIASSVRSGLVPAPSPIPPLPSSPLIPPLTSPTPPSLPLEPTTVAAITWGTIQSLHKAGRITIFKAGVLHKLSSSHSTGDPFWKRRFIVLTHDALHAFRDPVTPETESIGYLALDGSSSAAPSDEGPNALDVKTLVPIPDPAPNLPAVEYRIWSLKSKGDSVAAWIAAAKLAISHFRTRRGGKSTAASQLDGRLYYAERSAYPFSPSSANSTPSILSPVTALSSVSSGGGVFSPVGTPVLSKGTPLSPLTDNATDHERARSSSENHHPRKSRHAGKESENKSSTTPPPGRRVPTPDASRHMQPSPIGGNPNVHDSYKIAGPTGSSLSGGPSSSTQPVGSASVQKALVGSRHSSLAPIASPSSSSTAGAPRGALKYTPPSVSPTPNSSSDPDDLSWDARTTASSTVSAASAPATMAASPPPLPAQSPFFAPRSSRSTSHTHGPQAVSASSFSPSSSSTLHPQPLEMRFRSLSNPASLVASAAPAGGRSPSPLPQLQTAKKAMGWSISTPTQTGSAQGQNQLLPPAGNAVRSITPPPHHPGGTGGGGGVPPSSTAPSPNPWSSANSEDLYDPTALFVPVKQQQQQQQLQQQPLQRSAMSGLVGGGGGGAIGAVGNIGGGGGGLPANSTAGAGFGAMRVSSSSSSGGMPYGSKYFHHGDGGGGGGGGGVAGGFAKSMQFMRDRVVKKKAARD
ncbi:hypothetical protein DFJ73DRAFT_921525 [Zopfochytrium polystomum]|nr:hypothetical protein DFJ73DRAFT_921525 [Zopfochytrium polystomum]